MKKKLIISIFINITKININNVLNKLFEIGKKYNIRFQLRETKNAEFKEYVVSENEYLNKCKYAIVIGGDGTFISAAHYFMNKNVPLLGINIGNFGFLTEVEENEIEENIINLTKKKIKIEERMMLTGKLYRMNKVVTQFAAFNEIVINKGISTKIIKIRAEVDRHYIGTFAGDGVMVSTPTGSTGYSLSANGPIVYPTMDVLVFNTICPHTLTSRPIIVPSNSYFLLKVVNHKSILSYDGLPGITLLVGDKVIINKSKMKLKIITSPDRNFFDILREKFKWVE